MAQFFLSIVFGLLLSSALTSCGGGRSERIRSACLVNDDCSGAAICEAQRCVVVESASVEARGAVQGAPPGTRVEEQVVGSEVCREVDAKLVCTVERGSKVVLVAPEVDGYRFAGWSGPSICGGTAPILELEKLVENTECIARYVRRLRVSGAVADEESALVVASALAPFSQCDANTCVVDEGSDVVLTAPQRDGFRIVGFEGAGCGAGEGYQLTVAPRGADVTCTASYVESLTVRGQLQGVADAALQGEIVRASSNAEGAVCDMALCAVDPGQAVVLLAPEIAGHRFRGWIGDERCSGSERELTIEGVSTNLVCTADYVERMTVRGESRGAMAPIMATADDGFAVCDGAACEIDRGGNVTLIAGTAAGFRLRDWSGEGCMGASGSSASARDVQKNTTCVATFVEGVAVSGTLVNAEGVVEAASISAGAMCSEGRCAIDVGGTVTLSVPALPGRTFRGWSGDEGCTGSTRTITLTNVTESADCRATFAPRYQAQARVAPTSAGTVVASSATANARCVGASCEVDEGATVTFVATPSANFRFSGWSGGGACTGSTPRLELRDLRTSVLCSANFVARIQVSGEAAPSGAGTIAASSLSPSAQCTGATCTVDSGSDVMLRATAAAGSRFTRWTGCGNAASAGNNPLLLMAPTSSQSCTANFERLTYPVAAVATTGGSVTGTSGGQSCPNARCTVAHGEGASFTATAAAGYTFAGWSECGTSDQRTITLSDVTGPATCRASFSRIQLTVTALAGSGGTVTASTGGATCMNARCSIDYGATVTVEATAAAGAEFTGWSGCSTSTMRTLQLPNVMSSQTCTANFRALEYTVRGAVSAAGGGDVSCRNGCTVRHGGSISLTATANTAQGYRFAGWTDCTPATANPIALSQVTSDRICTASFERQSVTVRATPAPTSTGTVSVTSAAANCSGASCTVPWGSRVTLTATPVDANHRFLRWSGTGCTGTSAQLVVPMATANLACTASFERFRWNITWTAVTALAPVTIEVQGATCANNRCTRTVTRDEAVSTTLRFNTPSTTGIPTFAGWNGCSAAATDFAASVIPGQAAFTMTFASTFRNFDRDATCEARIEPGALALFGSPGSVTVTPDQPSFCADIAVNPQSSSRMCASPADTSYAVQGTGIQAWYCVIQHIPDGTVDDPVFQTPSIYISALQNHFVTCGGD